jgi:hypothetical protein
MRIVPKLWAKERRWPASFPGADPVERINEHPVGDGTARASDDSTSLGCLRAVRPVVTARDSPAPTGLRKCGGHHWSPRCMVSTRKEWRGRGYAVLCRLRRACVRRTSPRASPLWQGVLPGPSARRGWSKLTDALLPVGVLGEGSTMGGPPSTDELRRPRLVAMERECVFARAAPFPVLSSCPVKVRRPCRLGSR